MNMQFNKALDESMARAEKEARANLEAGKDQGHEDLIKDLHAIYMEARSLEFHDFLNTKHPAPKMALADKLLQLRENVVNGKYDN